MKYTIDTEVNLPRDKVISLFRDTSRFKSWQPDLLDYQHKSGEVGKEGAKADITQRFGKKEVVVEETVVSENLPDEISYTYIAKGIWNKVENRFAEIGPSQTRWTFTSEFRCSGFLRVLAAIMPGLFKRASQKYMRQFKSFAESA